MADRPERIIIIVIAARNHLNTSRARVMFALFRGCCCFVVHVCARLLCRRCGFHSFSSIDLGRPLGLLVRRTQLLLKEPALQGAVVEMGPHLRHRLQLRVGHEQERDADAQHHIHPPCLGRPGGQQWVGRRGVRGGGGSSGGGDVVGGGAEAEAEAAR